MATKRTNGNCIFDNVDYSYPQCGGIMVFKGRKNYRFETFSNYQGQEEYTYIIPMDKIDINEWKRCMRGEEIGWAWDILDYLIEERGFGRRIYRGTIF